MTFANEGEDLNKIIARFYSENGYFHIEYLDGTKECYFCTDESEKQKIKSTMINQAIKRQNVFDKECFNIDLRMLQIFGNSLYLFGIALVSNFLYKNNLITLCSLPLLCSGINISNNTRIKTQELKKYRMFLELLDSLDKINENCSFPFDIDTLDDISYKHVKTLYKTYKLKENLDSDNIK